MVIIDGGLIGEYGFAGDVASGRVFLDRRFPYVRGWSVLKRRLFHKFRLILAVARSRFLVHICPALDGYLRCLQ